MRMPVSVEFADAGTKTGTHRVLVVGGCSDATAAGDIGKFCFPKLTEAPTANVSPRKLPPANIVSWRVNRATARLLY